MDDATNQMLRDLIDGDAEQQFDELGILDPEKKVPNAAQCRFLPDIRGVKEILTGGCWNSSPWDRVHQTGRFLFCAHNLLD